MHYRAYHDPPAREYDEVEVLQRRARRLDERLLRDLSGCDLPSPRRRALRRRFLLLKSSSVRIQVSKVRRKWAATIPAWRLGLRAEEGNDANELAVWAPRLSPLSCRGIALHHEICRRLSRRMQ